jgi:hypothetical protein
MFIVSKNSLKFLAALAWYTGGVVLILKGSNQLSEAHKLKPDHMWPWPALLAGMALGSWRERFLFSRFCIKNIARIDALEQPKIWQFFRPGFFGLLLLMILTGAILSWLALGTYPLLIIVSILEITIATALMVSGRIFWMKKNPEQDNSKST